jgi:uncharacterized hydrophobic protein (TIGR00271 family)
MLNRAIAAFRLFGEREQVANVIENIEKGVVFKGTNLWILIAAIFIASLGLNVNSTAVIIGAMLISPLMGPIMGIGLSLGINDLKLLKKSLSNFLLAGFVSLVTSTLYFLISPLNEAHSEILARTSPNIYDALIALFGGFAGILATSSRQKGNVIPGVAIATALMPPLCTAGFGLANLNPYYFLGAFYLYLINSVFIAWATYLTVKLLKFPAKEFEDPNRGRRSSRLITAIVLLTLIPSIYLAIKFIRDIDFETKAKNYIANETSIEGNYLLESKIDAPTKSIKLVYGGKDISEEQYDSLKFRLNNYGIDEKSLSIRQGFSMLGRKQIEKKIEVLAEALMQKDDRINELKAATDSAKQLHKLSAQLLDEIKTQYPQMQSFYLSGTGEIDSTGKKIILAAAELSKPLKTSDRLKLEDWLRVRLSGYRIKTVFQP